MPKDKRKKKQQAAEDRRKREMERLQKTVEKQLSELPPRDEESGTHQRSEPQESFPALQPADELWDRFEHADLKGKTAVFLEALDRGELDSEYAFEMLTSIRMELGNLDPQARAQFAGLVQRLRQGEPSLYGEDILYYHRSLISDAIAERRWQSLPGLLAPFAEKMDLDLFFQVIDQLKYHGQESSLISVMKLAWPKVSASGDYFPEAKDEFASELILLILWDYLDSTETPRPDDPLLLKATSPFMEWNEGWLEWFIPCITEPIPSTWQVADFGPAVDADQSSSFLS